MSGPMNEMGAGRRRLLLSEAIRRYHRRFWPAMAAYVVLLLTMVWVISAYSPPAPWRYLVGVVPTLPLLAVIAIVGRYLIEETDEFLRRVMVESILWGLAGVLAASTVWGFLEVVGAPHIPPYWVFPAHCAFMGLSQPFIWRRYQ